MSDDIVRGPVYTLGDPVTFRHVGDSERRRLDQTGRSTAVDRARATGQLDSERRRRLLAQTPLGQQVLREEGHDSQQVAAFAAPPAKPFDPELADLDRRLTALEQRSRESGLTPARRRELLEASEVGRAVLKAETEAEWAKRAREEDERADRLPRLVQELRADGRPGRTSLVWPGDRQ